MVKLNCKICGKEFTEIPSRAKFRKTCSRSCHAIWNNTGRKHTRETILKMRYANAWKYIDEIVKKYKSGYAILWLAKEYKSDKRIIRNILQEQNIKFKGRKGIRAWNKGLHSERWKGKNNPNWKGGISPLNTMIRSLLENKEWRKKVFQRDNYTCQKCDRRGGDLEADHYPIMFSTILEKSKIVTIEQAINCKKLWDISNGRTLCLECHNKTKNNQVMYSNKTA